MSRCIIHVGMHKTGTSSIQQSLNGFVDEAFVYANIDGQPNHSRALFNLFGFIPGKPPARKSESGFQQNRSLELDAAAMAVLDRSIKAAEGRTYLLSGEGIALLPRDELEKLHVYLRNWFDEITIVAAVRSPAAYMASAFQEGVKQGVQDCVNVSRQYRSYKNTFNKFDEVFGRENVRLWKFDPQSFPGGCAVRDFCNRLGIGLPAERIVRVNESISREAVGLLFTYRKLGKSLGSLSMTGPQNYKLVQQVMGIGNSKFRFSPDVVRPVLEKNRADIEWMERRLGQSLHEELGEHRPGDVRDEADLLTQSSQVVRQLLALLGDRAPAGMAGETPEQVALLVHALRSEHVLGASALMRGNQVGEPEADPSQLEQRETRMKVTELIEQIQQANPKLLAGIPANRAAALIRNAFKHMNEALAETEEGVVIFAGLGQFRVRKVEKEVEGEKVIRTQIAFRRAELDPGKASNQSAQTAV